MIIIRPYLNEDITEILRVHNEQNFGYDLPDPRKMAASAIVEVDLRIELAGFLRKTSEVYVLFDSWGSRKERLGKFLALQKELSIAGVNAGFTDTHCWLPPEIDKEFGKLLLHLGWKKPKWTCYHYEVKTNG